MQPPIFCLHNPRTVLVFLFVQHLALLVLILLAAAAAGSVLPLRDAGLALRSAAGFAILAQANFLFALAGILSPGVSLAFISMLLIIAAIRWRTRSTGVTHTQIRMSLVHRSAIAGIIGFLLLLAIYPPVAFDETLYHLPFVQSYAATGSLTIVPNHRFPVFPVLHEVLVVPVFLAAGDTGPHIGTLAQLLVLSWIVADWSTRRVPRSGPLAVALLIGSPLVVHLGTVLYVEIALALFVTAGFYALDRRHDLLAAFLLGSACGVKYLGFYFAAAALVIVVFRERRRLRTSATFSAVLLLAALPTTLWIFNASGELFFPFFGSSPWRLPISESRRVTEHLMRLATLPWDVVMARARVGLQPPMTPLFVVMLVVPAIAATQDRLARGVTVLGFIYLCIFLWLPPDSRYLVALLPLLAVTTAGWIAHRWRRILPALTVIAILPGLAYAGYRFAHWGLPPATAVAREAWIERRIPESRALQRVEHAKFYSCGCEQLRSYAPGTLMGDYSGPYSYVRILGDERATSKIAPRIRDLGAEYFLVAKRRCNLPIEDGGMPVIYDDPFARVYSVPATAPLVAETHPR